MSLSESTVRSPDAIRPLRVLMVDDDGLQLRAFQRVLRGQDHVSLSIADNAIDALLHVGVTKPDVVVMDVFMPGLDGLEACRRIKANPQTADVSVVLATAAVTPELEDAAIRAGATTIVSKPIDIAAVLDIIVIEQPEERPPTPTVRGADLLVEMLADAGVDHVFGIPGGAISPVHDALLDSTIRVITTRHESGAMFAAAAYARTGKLGVVAVTSGPGVLNSLTGLASASCDGLPVLLLVGEVPRAVQGRGVLQDGSSHGLQIVEICRYISKLALEVPRASALPHLLRRAIATAMSGRRGPVVMTLPLDVMTSQLAPPAHAGEVGMQATIDVDSVDEVVDLLVSAERPLILAGSGVRNGACEALRLAAERLSIPVATTPKGKGVFPENHPLALGVVGLGGHRSARRYLDAEVDVVVAIGTSLGDMATENFSPKLQGTRAFVHVDIDARQHGRSYAPTHSIVARASEFLTALAERAGDEPSSRRSAPLRAMPAGIERHPLPSSKKHGRIAAQDALREIQDVLPANAIFTVDSGEHFVFATHYLVTNDPESFVVMTGLGSMGQSIGAAIGSQLAYPDRMIAAIVGDGCFAMNAFEVATAVADRLPIRVFVFNDERLGMVEMGHQNVYGRRPQYPTTPLDVCTVAKGLGATVMRVDGIGQIRAARELIAHAQGPVVVDVRIDPDISLPKRDRVAAMAPSKTPPSSPSRPRLHAH